MNNFVDNTLFSSSEILVENAQFDDFETIDNEDEALVVRGARSLQDIYSRCNLAMAEPTCYTDAYLDRNQKEAIDAKIKTTEKNGTWIIIDKPKNQNIICVK